MANNDLADVLARMAGDLGMSETPSAFDPKVAREVVREQGQGRKPETYQQCLEFHGFTWHPINRRTDGRLDPQWRNVALQCSFTEDDLTTGFRSPEDLDRWLRSWKLSRRAQGL